jgi:hypothetical protein
MTFPDKYDLAEAIPERVTPDGLQLMLEEAKPVDLAVETEAEDQDDKPQFKFESVGDAMARPYTSPIPLVGPICEGNAVEFYSPSGAGKSFVATSMALGIAAGKTVFDWFVPRSRKVAYVEGEMGDNQFRERLVKLAQGMKIDLADISENLHIAAFDLQDGPMPYLDSPEFMTIVDALPRDVACIIVDTVRSLVSPDFKENDSDSWRPISNNLAKMRGRNISLIVVHHANRQGPYSGSGEQERNLDQMIEIVREDSNKGDSHPEISFKRTKSRVATSISRERWKLTDINGGLAWVEATSALAHSLKNARESKDHQLDQKIIGVLRRFPGPSYSHLKKTIGGSKDDFKKRIDALLDDGQIIRVVDGKAHRYYAQEITDHGDLEDDRPDSRPGAKNQGENQGESISPYVAPIPPGKQKETRATRAGVYKTPPSPDLEPQLESEPHNEKSGSKSSTFNECLSLMEEATVDQSEILASVIDDLEDDDLEPVKYNDEEIVLTRSNYHNEVWELWQQSDQTEEDWERYHGAFLKAQYEATAEYRARCAYNKPDVEEHDDNYFDGLEDDEEVGTLPPWHSALDQLKEIRA